MNLRSESTDKCTLVLYPHTRGIAYVLCNGPKDIVDYGIRTVRCRLRGKLEKSVDSLLENTKPNVVILGSVKDLPQLSSLKGRLLRYLIKQVKLKELPLYQYTRTDIKHSFLQFGCETKYEIAMRLIEWFPFLSSRRPYKRNAWSSEDHNMPYFDAFALMLTHYYII